MQNIIRNLYKARGLFVCKHPAHEKFDFEVSPYHVIKQKDCLGKGCVEFLWRCNIGNKGKKCPRGFKHVGRNCFSCKYYYEEKICRMPEAMVDNEKLEQFFKDLEDFEYWLSTVENKRIKFSGVIFGIHPSLLKTIDNNRISTRMTGFLIKFESGHIGYDLFDDVIYLRIGNTFMHRHKPAPGDEIEFEAELKNDRGRMVMIKPTHVEIVKNGAEQVIDYSKALVGKTAGAVVTDDTRLCRECPYGALLDVHIIQPKENRFRRFYCLRGVEHASTCPIRLEKILNQLDKPSISSA